MENRIVKKPAFTVIGCSRVFQSEEGYTQCPKFWTEHYESGNGQYISGTYGICIDKPGTDSFRYMIADDYVPAKELPEGFETLVIPESSWAVFPCKGPLPQSLQSVNTKIFTEWLPGNPDYEPDGSFNVEYYEDPSNYPKGNLDENYSCEIWMPVKAKK